MFLRLQTLVPNMTNLLHTNEDRILNGILIGLLSIEALIVLWVVLMTLVRRSRCRKGHHASPSLEKDLNQDWNAKHFAATSKVNVHRYQHAESETFID